MLDVLRTLANALTDHHLAFDHDVRTLSTTGARASQVHTTEQAHASTPSATARLDADQVSPRAPQATLDFVTHPATERAPREEEARCRALARALPDIAVFLFDHDLRFLLAEGAALAAQGYRRETVEGRKLADVLTTERAVLLEPLYRKILTGEGLDFTWETDDRSYQVRGRPVHDERGHVIAGLIVSQDVTARLQAERALRESEARYRALIDNSTDAILLATPDGRIIAANPAACRMFRGSEEAIRSAGQTDLVDTSDPQLAVLLAVLASTGHATGEVRHRRLDNTIFPAEVTSVIFRDRDGQLRTTVTIRDITARKQMEGELRASQERLMHLAMHDALTGLPNRRRLGEAMSAALARFREDGPPLALLLLDLDGFKAVNDTWGHVAGDCLLVDIADRLRAELGRDTLVARLGGDEFAVLLEGEDAENSSSVTRAIGAAIARPVRIGAADAEVTASLGVAVATADDTTTTLLRRADAALYAAKRAGGNRHVLSLD